MVTRDRRSLGDEDIAEVCSLATRVLNTGNIDQAIDLLSTAMQTKPEHPDLVELLGRAHLQCGRAIEGLQLLDRVVEIGGASADTWRHMADGLVSVGEYAQAIGAYERCLELDTSNHEARHNYGRALYRLGEIERAAKELRKVIKETDAVESWVALATLAPGCPSIDAQQVLEIRRSLAERLAKPKEPNQTSRVRSKSQPLRVGYLCAFFDRPNYMKPVWALINNHDRSQFQLHLFSDSEEIPSSSGYQPHADDTIHFVSDINNDALSSLIQNQEIDVLVDLNAYSISHRLSLFTTRVAPVVVAWFNMYATSGLPGIDYILGDKHVISAAEEANYSEQVIRLSQSYLSFEVYHSAPDVVAPPCESNGYITFGSFVTQYKIIPAVLDAWAEILRLAPSAKLLLANTSLDSPQNGLRLLDEFAERKIARNRIQLLGSAKHEEFLRYYDRIDIALDSFPYNGGTTTMEAIWQGVPVIAFDGDRWASRTSLTILRDAQLDQFVGQSLEDYIQLAATWGNDSEAAMKLAEIRQGMRSHLRQTDACNGTGLARSMEELLTELSFKAP